MQSALVAGGAVPLATGAAAAGSILVTFLQGGINALNALSTSLTDVASAVSSWVHELIQPWFAHSNSPHHYSSVLSSIQLGSLLLRRLPARRLPLSRKSRLPLLKPCRRLSPLGNAIKANIAGTAASGTQESVVRTSRQPGRCRLLEQSLQVLEGVTGMFISWNAACI